jgi:hypothetical protein
MATMHPRKRFTPTFPTLEPQLGSVGLKVVGEGLGTAHVSSRYRIGKCRALLGDFLWHILHFTLPLLKDENRNIRGAGWRRSITFENRLPLGEAWQIGVSSLGKGRPPCLYFGGKRIVICTRAQVVPSLWILRFQVAKDKGNFRHMRGPRSGIDKFKESSLNHWVRMAEVRKIVQINIPSYTWFAALEANSRAGHRM